ncbi:hypothetical protein Ahy_B02g057450 [Arachis hypogaea]|uniref:R13L1/DRL21-like LRR repeat region domain-containing protein n=1 Tax=Arachis hypogaea TaxID=3818 RepID=A0A445ABU3_ARAHY|nr:hypothetical protein Ahy_B02g057450 [Arachis hypogaea]
MHEFIQDLARNECRIMLPGEESGDNDAVTEPARYRHFTRHCTLYLEDKTSFLDSIDNGGKLKADKLHTLMVLSKFSDMDPTNLANSLPRMKRIRALDLSDCPIEKLPSKATELLHLRYLNLSFNHKLKELPSEISNLLNLQTLNLNGCKTEISEATRADLKNKENLLGLELWFSMVGSKANDQVLLDSLEAPPQLQSLGIFDYGGRWTGINVNGGDKKIMPQLSSLSVVNCEKLESLPDYIKKKENLKPVIEGCPLLLEN